MRSLRAARHELRCRECRVTWKSWLQRLLGISKGYTPTVKRSSDSIPAFLSPGRSTVQRPGETAVEAMDRLMEGEDL